MFSAFVSAAVAVHDAIRTTLSRVQPAEAWWRNKGEELRKDPLFEFFDEIRNDIQHQGLNPLERMIRSFPEPSLFLAEPGPLGDDALASSKELMALVAGVAAEAYRQFWSHLNIPASYSLDDLRGSGASLEQVEAEFGLHRGWSGGADVPDEERLERLKVYSQTAADDLVRKYIAAV